MNQIAVHGKREFDYRNQAGMVKELSPRVQQAIYGGQGIAPTQQLQVTGYYSAKKVGAVDVFNDLFSPSDVQTIKSATYLTNLNGGKLEADKLFLLTHIQLLFGNASDINATTFGLLNDAMLGGHFGIKQADRVIVNKYTPMRIFDTAEFAIQSGNGNEAAATALTITNKVVGAGLIEVAPKFILPQSLIEVEMKFAKALSANDNVMIFLWGVQNENL